MANVGCGLPPSDAVLASDSRTGVGIRIGNVPYAVVWPSGYSARRDLLGPIVLVDPGGRDVAQEGNVVRLNGGFDPDNVFHACSDPHLEVLK